ncbi:hypothetical protein CXF77_08100 (plasmid) [Planococcus sp. MB-3u-09]|nr:hypothetical protein CW734_00985 [Planococcus sp. MB-3u-03]PKG47119.1 hypothetical protein CXF66_04780 [Planococcus sp. Urea-trap-24]PKG87685.1 hypothetical protein CXF91_17080 [Planococcus sp. Urea-3u-39]PKG87752.1 hypothetical protein CXF91_17430 [Planococcus sp. Urea-3u-39]PKH40420.1 hypothetical protein CXF77_08100 [Planococcus sp. MB-3u-09]
MIEMKEKLHQVLVFQERVQKQMDGLIDRLSRTAIDQEERKFELMYDKPLNEKEILDIKKTVVMKYSLSIVIPLLILILTIMNRGVM